LKKDLGVTFTYKNSKELANKYNCGFDYNNGLPSIFSPYNLLIINEENNKMFVHSWHDYAPSILEKGSGIELFNVIKFSCVSRLNQDVINKHKEIKIQPSVYLLENLSEYKLIEKYGQEQNKMHKVYMNALCYGLRERYIDVLNNSDFFKLKKKNIGDYMTKEKYYEEFSKYKFALSLDGAAKICYRDLEAFGLGSLLLREKLDVMTYEPIIEGKHYLEFIDDDIKSKINSDTEITYIINKLEKRITDLINKPKTEQIIDESRQWFERNCLPENQIKIIYSFLENYQIFK